VGRNPRRVLPSRCRMLVQGRTRPSLLHPPILASFAPSQPRTISMVIGSTADGDLSSDTPSFTMDAILTSEQTPTCSRRDSRDEPQTLIPSTQRDISPPSLHPVAHRIRTTKHPVSPHPTSTTARPVSEQTYLATLHIVSYVSHLRSFRVISSTERRLR
jgi:hypothetical protein